MKNNLLLSIFLIFLIIVFSACTIQNAGYLVPNDRFAFPNSNVVPLGRVEASASKWSIFVPSIMYGEDLKKLREEALKQKGGDIIINGKTVTKIKIVSLLYINFFKTETTISGTAAKMTIGRQELK